ncbi:glycosyltransferase family 4 protein [Aurantiacibacter hainanensis]|uniref:glycosyltransferase family 4 protein n=1 Tax=Aurantiacibacter hainanensis TaxID=3076114 RepID=UPI0030C7493A
MRNLNRIVVVVPDCGEGGLFQFYNKLLPELALHADVHAVFASPYHTSSAPSIPGATCHFIPAEAAAPLRSEIGRGVLSLAPDIANAVAVAYRAWDVVQALEPDIVEVCDWPFSFVPAVLEQSVPYLVQCHGSAGQIARHDPQQGHAASDLLAQLLEPQLLAVAHRVQTYSEANAHYWLTETRREINVIRPAFPLSEVPKSEQRAPGSPAVFGRLQRWKGPHTLCEALRLLGPDALEVNWYGSVKPWGTRGITAAQYLRSVFPEIWGEKFIHHPAISRTEVSKIQAQARFIIVPSTWDVFNFTAVEAMSSARPLMISTGAGASELIVDGENGFTFANEDPDSLATAMDRVLSMSRHRLREVGMAGRETVRTALDPRRVSEERLAAYQEAVNSFSLHPPRRPSSALSDIFDPRISQTIGIDELLGALPLKSIGRHVSDRLLQKVRSRLGLRRA